MEHQLIRNNFLPSWEIKTLVLGTFNPEGGDVVDYFYGRGRNNFWKAIAYAQLLPIQHYYENFDRKKECMNKHKFGCTDIIKSVEVNNNYIHNIIGNGYSDSKLFNLENVKREYQFDKIKEYLIENNVNKVIYTWGLRKGPNEFSHLVNEFKQFCFQNKINFVELCPSPSPRSRNTIEHLAAFYSMHLLN